MNVSYLLFLGFPAPYEPTVPKESRRKPTKRIEVDEERTYRGVNSQTHGWSPGEPRKLEDEEKVDNEGETRIVFDSRATARRILRDLGENAPAFAHIPEKKRSLFGFRQLDEAGYRKALRSWERSKAA